MFLHIFHYVAQDIDINTMIQIFFTTMDRSCLELIFIIFIKYKSYLQKLLNDS